MTSNSPARTTRQKQTPWALAVGVALLVFCVAVFLFAGGGSPMLLVLGFAGLMLLCVGLIQQSIEKARRP